MFTEFAEIEVKPGLEGEFIAGVEKSREIFLRASGCHGMTLQRSVEAPSRFLLIVQWDTVAHHTETFRNSPDFARWRQNVGHCFAATKVWHGEQVV